VKSKLRAFTAVPTDHARLLCVLLTNGKVLSCVTEICAGAAARQGGGERGRDWVAHPGEVALIFTEFVRQALLALECTLLDGASTRRSWGWEFFGDFTAQGLTKALVRLQYSRAMRLVAANWVRPAGSSDAAVVMHQMVQYLQEERESKTSLGRAVGGEVSDVAVLSWEVLKGGWLDRVGPKVAPNEFLLRGDTKLFGALGGRIQWGRRQGPGKKPDYSSVHSAWDPLVQAHNGRFLLYGPNEEPVTTKDFAHIVQIMKRLGLLEAASNKKLRLSALTRKYILLRCKDQHSHAWWGRIYHATKRMESVAWLLPGEHYQVGGTTFEGGRLFPPRASDEYWRALRPRVLSAQETICQRLKI
jgi:hypothetical protein